jgi:hypothetical protein
MAKSTSEPEGPVERALGQHGPMTSQELSDALVLSKSVSNPDAARKLIERARKSQKTASTFPVRFDKSYLYYLEKQQGRAYAQAIRKILPQKPSFQRVYKTVLANKGWITLGQIGKASGCLPTGDKSGSGGRLPLEVVVDHLKRIRLIEDVAGEKELYRIGTQFGSVGIRRAAFRKKLELEQGLLMMFRDWVRNCYLVAYDSHTIRASETSIVDFNQTHWDFHGPVYFGPFSESKALTRASQGGSFVVAEFLGFRQFTIVDCQSTIERVRSIGHRWKTTSLIPIAVAPAFSQDAWNQLRAAGVIAATVRDVFGPNIEELLRRFCKAIASDAPTAQNLDEIEQSLVLTKGTVASEGLLGNLKGALFELIVALGLRADGYDTTLQKMVRRPDVGEEFEIDIVATRSESLCKLFECKGRREGYTERRHEIERHFNNRCRAASDPFGWNVTAGYKAVEAIFVSTGALDEDAENYVRTTKESHGISCSHMDRQDLLNYLMTVGQPRLVELVKNYY